MPAQIRIELENRYYAMTVALFVTAIFAWLLGMKDIDDDFVLSSIIAYLFGRIGELEKKVYQLEGNHGGSN